MLLMLLLLLLLVLILLLLLLLDLISGGIHEISLVRIWVRRQHVRVVLLLGAVYRLRKSRGSCRIDSSIGGIEVVLVVKLEVESQSVVVLIHIEEGAHRTGQECSLLAAGLLSPVSSDISMTVSIRSLVCD